jgi:2-keto-4-pentenoate hydratase/2-oxohepta-3-ene-1,7-dioic acid hydratase in catechol pathway
MRFRRAFTPDGAGATELECCLDGLWQACAEADAPAWLAALAPDASPSTETPLPFAPRSFRDCMLYEQHWEQASRGYTRLFMPAAYRLSQTYEATTRRTFPPFRLHKSARRQPFYYFGNHLSIIPSATPVHIPAFTTALDYELELGMVLKHDLRDATPAQAEAAIGGFVVVNDFSARDIQRNEMGSGFGPQKCKHFSSSISRELAMAEAILPQVERLEARVELNGETVTRTTSAGLLHSLGETLSYLSRDEPLFAGELIATGTLPGGCGMERGRLLEPGDRLRLVIDDIGEINHVIRANKHQGRP